MAGKLMGYAGRFLDVDLTRGALSDRVFDEETLRLHLGGTGIGAKLLYDEVPRDAAWGDPRNIVSIASGPLGGTAVGGSGTISIVTRGALTGGATSVQANGLFGAYMRFSGYDGVIVKGSSKGWRYLAIRDGKAELRDAQPILGLDTYEATDRLREMHGAKGREASVLSIGPAGEKLVRFAGAFVDHGHSASHNGPGAVLGSKRLKAMVAFRGGGRVEVYDAKRLAAAAQEMYKEVEYFRGTIGGVANMYRGAKGDLPVKNYMTYDWGATSEQVESFTEKSIRDRYQVERVPCWGCRLLHSTMMEVKGERYKCRVEEPEYEQMAAWGPVIGNADAEAAMMLSGLTDRLGLENNEAGWLVGWVMECAEKGYITEDQLGFRTGWGDVAGAERILRMVADREGFGDVLAEGVKRASERVEGKAAECAIYTMKGNSPRGHDHRTRWSEMFDTSVSNTGTIETHMSAMSPQSQGPANPMEVSGEVARTKGLMQLEDSVGTCRFNTRMDAKRIAEAVSAATGWDMGAEEAWDVGRRAVNLLRAFNLESGIGHDLDRPSARYGSTPVDGPTAGVGIMPHWDAMLANYYARMGWDERGVPKRETLEQLGLGHVWAGLRRL